MFDSDYDCDDRDFGMWDREDDLADYNDREADDYAGEHYGPEDDYVPVEDQYLDSYWESQNEYFDGDF